MGETDPSSQRVSIPFPIARDTICAYTYSSSLQAGTTSIFSRDDAKGKARDASELRPFNYFMYKIHSTLSNPFRLLLRPARYTFLTVMRCEMGKNPSWRCFDSENMLKLMFELHINCMKALTWKWTFREINFSKRKSFHDIWASAKSNWAPSELFRTRRFSLGPPLSCSAHVEDRKAFNYFQLTSHSKALDRRVESENLKILSPRETFFSIYSKLRFSTTLNNESSHSLCLMFRVQSHKIRTLIFPRDVKVRKKQMRDGKLS